MKQLEPHAYLLGVGETTTVRLEGMPSAVMVSIELDGHPLPPDRNEFQVTGTDKESNHKLLLYFQPTVQETVSFVVGLFGSEGGSFQVPIELVGGLSQTRLFRFTVEGPASRFGVPG